MRFFFLSKQRCVKIASFMISCSLRGQKKQILDYSMNGYLKSVDGIRVSLMVRGLTQRMRLRKLPALSFVPEALDPPKGCCPTIAPVGLSFI